MNSALRIAVINHVHPMRAHVSALRMRTFSEKLAQQGAQVLLLSSPPDDRDPGTVPTDAAARLEGHDWTQPLYLSCKPGPGTLIEKAREGRLPGGIRQAVLGWSYLIQGGVFADWRNAVAPLLPTIADRFKPDVVFATFGNTDAWLIAQALAVETGCPWVADLKDNWSAFIPPGFRRITANRFADMAHMTVYSESHRREAEKWFGADKTVIYSGYDHGATIHAPLPPVSNIIVLSGSLYDDEHVRTLCDGIRVFVAASKSREPPSLQYAGNDTGRFAVAAAMLADVCPAKDMGYLAAAELAALQSSAIANVYIENPRSLFQQKVLEVLAAGRPVIAIPDEGPEARRIAGDVGGILTRCGDAEAVAEALTSASTVDSAAAAPEKIAAYSWAAQGNRLRDILLHVAGKTS